MLATDAAGSRSMRVGSTRDHVRSVEIVLAGGQCLELGNEPLEAELPSKDIAKPAVESLLSDPLGAVTDGMTALASSFLGGSSDQSRKSGKSSYNFRRRLSMAFEAIISFSDLPENFFSSMFIAEIFLMSTGKLNVLLE